MKVIKMKTIEEFINSWYSIKDRKKIRGIQTISGIIYANHFSINVSEFNGSYWINLYIVINKTLTSSGYIYLDEITEITVLSEENE